MRRDAERHPGPARHRYRFRRINDETNIEEIGTWSLAAGVPEAPPARMRCLVVRSLRRRRSPCLAWRGRPVSGIASSTGNIAILPGPAW
ncbi:protein of unknown function [Burkholderia multivorans]